MILKMNVCCCREKFILIHIYRHAYDILCPIILSNMNSNKILNSHLKEALMVKHYKLFTYRIFQAIFYKHMHKFNRHHHLHKLVFFLLFESKSMTHNLYEIF